MFVCLSVGGSGKDICLAPRSAKKIIDSKQLGLGGSKSFIYFMSTYHLKETSANLCYALLYRP